jgi:4-carboxymuconolactone decarboxylase
MRLRTQVKGHTAANLCVGNGRAMLLAVLTHLLPFIGHHPRSLNGRQSLNAVAPAAVKEARP